MKVICFAIHFVLWSLASMSTCHAQNLLGSEHVGEQAESDKEYVNQLELERSKLLKTGLKSEDARALYGSVVLELAETYEALGYWQKALAAQNSFMDLKLPKGAMQNCEGCLTRPTDDVLVIDKKRLQEKIQILEHYEQRRFDKKQRLGIPKWNQKQSGDSLPERYTKASNSVYNSSLGRKLH